MSINKVLIANRGEIALRILEACRELGFSTVAIYSEPDSYQPHVGLADESFCIGPEDPRESYLNLPAVMSTADISGADAIHPGYGFLAENPHFAEVCEEHGIKFVGPSSRVLAISGNKIEARNLVQETGVPTLPGSHEPINDEEHLLQITDTIGFPLILKAAFGGGGRGIRVIQEKDELVEAYNTSREEARVSFGNNNLYMEKYVPSPKHIEVQLIADNYGNFAHFGERECSIQRRHQKLVEETPAPTLKAETREKILDAALKIAQKFDYTSLGTAEFIVDQEENFYFIELNARIQVEHPISEELYGINLVKEQLKIADGKNLQDLSIPAPRGHAIECRINAENPESNFSPSSGQLNILQFPGGNGVRIDTWIRDGIKILPYYDSLLAKLIVHGETRKDTIMKAISSLRRLEIDGVTTTRNLYLDLLRHPKFRSGEYTSNWWNEFGLFKKSPQPQQEQ